MWTLVTFAESPRANPELDSPTRIARSCVPSWTRATRVATGVEPLKNVCQLALTCMLAVDEDDGLDELAQRPRATAAATTTRPVIPMINQFRAVEGRRAGEGAERSGSVTVLCAIAPSFQWRPLRTSRSRRPPGALNASPPVVPAGERRQSARAAWRTDRHGVPRSNAGACRSATQVRRCRPADAGASVPGDAGASATRARDEAIQPSLRRGEAALDGH